MIKIKRAWLLTWEWDGIHAMMEDKVAGIYPSRYSSSRIKEIMEILFHQSNSNLTELASYIAHPKSKPYKCEADSTGWLRCGRSSNPFLEGRTVRNISVTTQNRIETIEWFEEPKYVFKEETFVQITEGRRMVFERIVQGPLSIKRFQNEPTLQLR